MGAEDYATGCCFSLLCQEDGADLGDGFTNDEGCNLLLMYSAGADDDDEEDEEGYMDHLVSKESSFCSADPLPSMASEEWFQCARGDAVRWILETRGHFGFCHRTAYVAIAYFDRFSLRGCVDRSMMPWAARLLAISCVSLAAKMDEYRVPALSEFCADDDYDFSCDSIRRMELVVLSRLDWRMGAVTPFDYIPCLSSRLRRGNGAGRGGGGGLIAVKAASLIFYAAKVPSVLDYRPSTVAAVAVLAATHGALTRGPLESKMSSLSPSCLLEKEDVYACYTMMLCDPSLTSKRSASDPSDAHSTSTPPPSPSRQR